MARWCGNVPCSMPVRNTYGYSRPFAVCRVIIVTLPESSSSPGNWSESATNAMVSKIPPMWRLACSARIPPLLIAAGKDYRRGKRPADPRSAAALPIPLLASTSATTSDGFVSWSFAKAASSCIMSRNALNGFVVRVDMPSICSICSIASKKVVPWASAYRQRVLPHERPVRASAH